MAKKESEVYDLKREIDQLKNKIYYFAGSLETINYLLKLDDKDNVQNHLNHVKEIADRMISEMENDLIDLN